MKINKNNFKIALVHDFLVQYGGAERVLEDFCEIFPNASIYTLLYDKEKMRGKFANKIIRTSFLQKFPKFIRKKYRYILPLMPSAIENFDFRDFDIVISSCGAWSKGIVVRLNTIHVSYIHSPTRFIWDYNKKYLEEDFHSRFSICRFFARFLLNYLRVWDYEAAQRPDYLIANSKYTRERIKKYYRRESEVIYPPVNSNFQKNNSKISSHENIKEKDENNVKNNKYFLIVSRLSPYKKIDLAVEAFNKLELPLIIIGEGKQKKYLQKIAEKNISFLGWLPDEKISQYYQNARAFIFPGEEDFGIAMVEAMKHGVPVIAYARGGSREIIHEGVTGEFFQAQTIEVLADGVRRFIENEEKYDKNIIRQKVEKFNQEQFKKEIISFINEKLNKKF